MSRLGFGFFPEESVHHFLVCIPRKKDEPVVVYERFEWQHGEQKINLEESKIKAELPQEKWARIEGDLKKEFNTRLKKKKLPAGRFVFGQTPLELMLGKELLVLVWAVEDAEEKDIDRAIRNWSGFSPEERWWLYTVTNAITGNRDDRTGWRKALRYALCEN